MPVKMRMWRNGCAFSSMSAYGAGDEGRDALECVSCRFQRPAPLCLHSVGQTGRVWLLTFILLRVLMGKERGSLRTPSEGWESRMCFCKQAVLSASQL